MVKFQLLTNRIDLCRACLDQHPKCWGTENRITRSKKDVSWSKVERASDEQKRPTQDAEIFIPNHLDSCPRSFTLAPSILAFFFLFRLKRREHENRSMSARCDCCRPNCCGFFSERDSVLSTRSIFFENAYMEENLLVQIFMFSQNFVHRRFFLFKLLCRKDGVLIWSH